MDYNRKRKAALILNITGAAILALVMLLYLPITLPRLLGCQMYAIVSGSMEPEIAKGSLVYVKPAAPEQVAAGDVIAFHSAVEDDVVVAHRVVENDSANGEFVTKGDANAEQDIQPVAYSRLIGTVRASVPVLGSMASFLSSAPGKTLAVVGIALFFALFVLAGKLRGDTGGRNISPREK